MIGMLLCSYSLSAVQKEFSILLNLQQLFIYCSNYWAKLSVSFSYIPLIENTNFQPYDLYAEAIFIIAFPIYADYVTHKYRSPQKRPIML